MRSKVLLSNIALVIGFSLAALASQEANAAGICERLFLGVKLDPAIYLSTREGIRRELDPEAALMRLARQKRKADPSVYLAWVAELDPTLAPNIESFLVKQKRMKIPRAFSFSAFRAKTHKRLRLRMLQIADMVRTKEEVTRFQAFTRAWLPPLYVKAQLERDGAMLSELIELTQGLKDRGLLYPETQPLRSKGFRAVKHSLSWVIGKALMAWTLWIFYDQLKDLWMLHEQIAEMEELTEQSVERTKKLDELNKEFDESLELLQKRFPEYKLAPVEE